MTVGKIGNDLERGFVKHRLLLNCLFITDPKSQLISFKHETVEANETLIYLNFWMK